MENEDVLLAHKRELLAEHPNWTTHEWVVAALTAAERDFRMVNRLLITGHPLTWTPPLIEIALEKLRAT